MAHLGCWILPWISGFLLLLQWAPVCFGEIKHVTIKSDSRPLIMFERFGFSRNGRVEISVSDVTMHSTKSEAPSPDLSSMGFFLSTEEDLVQFLLDAERQKGYCVLKSRTIKNLFTLNELSPSTHNYSKTFPITESNEYALLFANCQSHVRINMKIRTAMYNFDEQQQKKDYLPVGQTQLPTIYFTFFVAYTIAYGVWVYLHVQERNNVHRIHIPMHILLILKALNLVAEGAYKEFIRTTGTAHGWDIVFYLFSFLKGIMLFTVLILIGTGWSILKPYLQDREKKLLMFVIPLQVVANFAAIVIDETGPSKQDWMTWKQLLLLLDIICCCAVLFPIVWSIKHLREASRTDGKAAKNMVKLMLFRQYYTVVVCYVYFTRIGVFALTTITDFRYRWVSVFAAEIGTLGFYLFTGYKFMPTQHNPYITVEADADAAANDDDDDDAGGGALKDDDFEL